MPDVGAFPDCADEPEFDDVLTAPDWPPLPELPEMATGLEVALPVLVEPVEPVEPDVADGVTALPEAESRTGRSRQRARNSRSSRSCRSCRTSPVPFGFGRPGVPRVRVARAGFRDVAAGRGPRSPCRHPSSCPWRWSSRCCPTSPWRWRCPGRSPSSPTDVPARALALVRPAIRAAPGRSALLIRYGRTACSRAVPRARVRGGRPSGPGVARLGDRQIVWAFPDCACDHEFELGADRAGLPPWPESPERATGFDVADPESVVSGRAGRARGGPVRTRRAEARRELTEAALGARALHGHGLHPAQRVIRIAARVAQKAALAPKARSPDERGPGVTRIARVARTPRLRRTVGGRRPGVARVRVTRLGVGEVAAVGARVASLDHRLSSRWPCCCRCPPRWRWRSNRWSALPVLPDVAPSVPCPLPDGGGSDGRSCRCHLDPAGLLRQFRPPGGLRPRRFRMPRASFLD